ncbi:MAG: hypothetical protein ACQEQV_08240 [Fibrobacterota bacterium]
MRFMLVLLILTTTLFSGSLIFDHSLGSQTYSPQATGTIVFRSGEIYLSGPGRTFSLRDLSAVRFSGFTSSVISTGGQKHTQKAVRAVYGPQRISVAENDLITVTAFTLSGRQMGEMFSGTVGPKGYLLDIKSSFPAHSAPAIVRIKNHESDAKSFSLIYLSK